MIFWHKIVVGDRERVLVIKNGRFLAILEPGKFLLWTSPSDSVETERHSLDNPRFESKWADFLVREKPAVVERHFLKVETHEGEIAVISIDGVLSRLAGPGQRMLAWRASGLSAEIVNAAETPEIPPSRLDAFARLARDHLVTIAAVPDGRVGLLVRHDKVERLLPPGNHGFWSVAGSPRVELVDLRLLNMEIPGQEIMTRDKVSLRVNIVAEWQVVDPLKARQAVADIGGHLYRLVQIAVRQALGKRTLDEILADKTDVDEVVAARVRAEAGSIGLRVGTIALKDIIPPGEVRDILNQVVAAEKQAQANLIRRREETAATRSLLNTAKLLEDNPVLMRLKELESLEKVVEKVGSITVTNGLPGLLADLTAVKR